MRPKQNGRRFADDTFKYILLNGNVIISIKISLKFIPKGPINIIPALVQIMAWHRPGDKSLSEPMMVRLPTYICINWPLWVNVHTRYYLVFQNLKEEIHKRHKPGFLDRDKFKSNQIKFISLLVHVQQYKHTILLSTLRRGTSEAVLI